MPDDVREIQEQHINDFKAFLEEKGKTLTVDGMKGMIVMLLAILRITLYEEELAWWLIHALPVISDLATETWGQTAEDWRPMFDETGELPVWAKTLQEVLLKIPDTYDPSVWETNAG